jgi:hypothetical protein
MRSGFNSRNAAIKAAGAVTFATSSELRQWLKSKEIVKMYDDPNLPTAETSSLWKAFVDGMRPELRRPWRKSSGVAKAKWYKPLKPSVGVGLRIINSSEGSAQIFGADYEPLGELSMTLASDHRGLLLATTLEGGEKVGWNYLGPDDLFPKATPSTQS